MPPAYRRQPKEGPLWVKGRANIQPIIRTVRYIIACYKEDKLEGDYCSYNKDAVVTRPHVTCKYRCHYVDGKRHGLARWWYKDGTLQEEGFYKQQTKASYKSYYEGGKLNELLQEDSEPVHYNQIDNV